MKNIDQDFNLIQQYLDGELPPEQRTQVEKRLEQEQDFARLYQRSRAAIQTIKDDAEKTTMAFLGELHQKEIKQEPKKEATPRVRQLPIRRILSIAAVLVLLLTATLWLFRPQNTSLTAFDNYYNRPAFDMQRGGQADALISDIIQAYNSGDFSTALERIEAYERSAGTQVNISLYKAVSLLETGETEQAQNVLQELKEQEEQLDEIYWLSAMTHLKSGDKFAASADLEVLLSDKFPVANARKQKAVELMKELQ